MKKYFIIISIFISFVLPISAAGEKDFQSKELSAYTAFVESEAQEIFSLFEKCADFLRKFAHVLWFCVDKNVV